MILRARSAVEHRAPARWWQHASASASAASARLRDLAQARAAASTIVCTAALSARPSPVTASFTSFGLYCATGTPGARRGHEREAARLPDRHRGARVGLEQHALDGERRRPQLARRARRARRRGRASRSGSGSLGAVRITPHGRAARAARRRGRRRRSRSAKRRGRCRARARPDRTWVRSYGSGPARRRTPRSRCYEPAQRAGSAAPTHHTTSRTACATATRHHALEPGRRLARRLDRSTRLGLGCARSARPRSPRLGDGVVSSACSYAAARVRRVAAARASKHVALEVLDELPHQLRRHVGEHAPAELRDLAGDRQIGRRRRPSCPRPRASSCTTIVALALP